MPRGITPRQPAKTGRHEGARKAAPHKKPGALRASTQARASTVDRSPARKPRANSGYNPTAPARVQEILQRLDPLSQMPPAL